MPSTTTATNTTPQTRQPYQNNNHTHPGTDILHRANQPYTTQYLTASQHRSTLPQLRVFVAARLTPKPGAHAFTCTHLQDHAQRRLTHATGSAPQGRLFCTLCCAVLHTALSTRSRICRRQGRGTTLTHTLSHTLPLPLPALQRITGENKDRPGCPALRP